jgi:predicted alpha/beta hydrolase family esterase
MRPILIVPGYRDSGPGHWQTLFEAEFLGTRRVAMPSFDRPVLHEWVGSLEEAVAACAEPPVLVAHSLGCIAVAHWATATAQAVHGAFLVAPCDVEKVSGLESLRDFAPIPVEPLPFPALVVVSTDDPFLDVIRGHSLAFSWGARLHQIERCGHVNVESGFGAWPDGQALLGELLG